jgi:hypothetical protein
MGFVISVASLMMHERQVRTFKSPHGLFPKTEAAQIYRQR